jgi:hypothetical protein
MAEARLPTPAQLCQLLRYEPETGKLYWRERPSLSFPSEGHARRWNGLWANQEALAHISADGYFKGKIWGAPMRAHRVIWAMVHGAWPEHDIDHINHNRADNRLANLRAVSRAENLKNMTMRRDNTSGVAGVTWKKETGRWNASIFTDGKRRHLGYYDSIAEAANARAAAEQEYGFHKNHGRSQILY